MYIGPNKHYADGTLIQDPTIVINTIPSNSNGIFSQLQEGTTTLTPTGISDLMDRLNKLELDNKCLRLKMLKMEGKFTQDEVINIRKMLISEDESSRTLAESIIENA
jgi:hypothetical protein